jgi:flavin-dependent dehydrogenase
VFVIGGGPAGLAAAIAARQRGFAVAVADGLEPPVDKACGEGLMPDTLRVLRELGWMPRRDWVSAVFVLLTKVRGPMRASR